MAAGGEMRWRGLFEAPEERVGGGEESCWGCAVVRMNEKARGGA